MSLIRIDDLIHFDDTTNLALCGAIAPSQPVDDWPASGKESCMERTRSPIEDLGVLELMAKNPVTANAQLTANALFGANELRAKRLDEDARGRDDLAAEAAEGEPEETNRGLLDRIDDWFWKLEQRALEERLAEATDIYDLEMRIREIERGAPWGSH